MTVDQFGQYASVLLVGWASGINLYLATALTGIAGKMGWIQLPGDMDLLSHPLVITAAILMFCVEFVADKVPYVDSAWDSVHTFIRPAGAAACGYLAGSEWGPAAEASLAVLSGTMALEMHTLKASSRLAVNTSPEPVSNIAVSTTEDAAVGVVFLLFIKHPILASIAIILMTIGAFFLIVMLWKFVRKLFSRKAPAGEEGSA